MDTRIKRSDSHKGAHYEQYTKIKARLEAFILKAKTSGKDTAALEAHVVVLNEKIQTFTTDYAAYQAALKESKTYTCGKSEGEFKTRVDGARAELKLVRADVKAIHDYLKSTIKPDLNALRPVSTEKPE